MSKHSPSSPVPSHDSFAGLKDIRPLSMGCACSRTRDQTDQFIGPIDRGEDPITRGRLTCNSNLF